MKQGILFFKLRRLTPNHTSTFSNLAAATPAQTWPLHLSVGFGKFCLEKFPCATASCAQAWKWYEQHSYLSKSNCTLLACCHEINMVFSSFWLATFILESVSKRTFPTFFNFVYFNPAREQHYAALLLLLTDCRLVTSLPYYASSTSCMA